MLHPRLVAQGSDITHPLRIKSNGFELGSPQLAISLRQWGGVSGSTMSRNGTVRRDALFGRGSSRCVGVGCCKGPVGRELYLRLLSCRRNQ